MKYSLGSMTGRPVFITVCVYRVNSQKTKIIVKMVELTLCELSRGIVDIAQPANLQTFSLTHTILVCVGYLYRG